MLVESVVDRAIEQILDGVPVDWPSLESSTRSDEERRQLRYLRIVGGIADLHRTEAETRDRAAMRGKEIQAPFDVTWDLSRN